jgi:hypothetical protein
MSIQVTLAHYLWLYLSIRRPVFESWQELKIFHLATPSTQVLDPTHPPIQWVTGSLSLGVKWPGHEVNHSPPSNAEVKEGVELNLHSLIRVHSVVPCLKKHRDKF